jgi:chitodextrinase
LNPLSLDTTPPGVITHLAAHTGNGTVTFVWQDPADSDFDHVEIWFGTSPSATSGTSVPSVSRGTMTAAWNGTPNDTLYCHFIAVDTAGNRSAVVNYMVKLEAVTADVTNLVGTISGADSVTLTWTDPIAPTFDHVEISSSGLPTQTAVKGLGTDTWNGLSTGTSYTFTVTAFYTGGGSSTGVPVSLILTQDTTPPGPVTVLGASKDGFGSVTLNWTNPGDPDLQYVEITCEPFIGPAKTVNASGGTYTWNGLAGGVTYTFTVKAVDDSGNRSEGVTVFGTTYDTTPPAPITSLVGIPGNEQVLLTWTDPGDADLNYIQIDYGMAQQGAAKGAQSYTWNNLTNDTAYTFTVKAVDTNGNRSAAVTVGPVTPRDSAEGTVSYAPVEGDPSKIWEIHTFTASVTLTFSSNDPVTADYLIVAGGGGSGGEHNSSTDDDFPGGGGAGGLLYKTGETLAPLGGSMTVIVGAGGAGAQSRQTQGADGGMSAIGTIEVPGGGGGGGAMANMTGRPGGSGGGGGAGKNSARGAGGGRSSIDPDIKGNSGGIGGNDSGGGGGGGAGGPGGTEVSRRVAGLGGLPWIAANNNASWLSAVTGGTTEFSRGGNGGGTNAPLGGRAGVNYGDGGLAGNNRQRPSAAGHSGVVVIRFQRPAGVP